MNHTRGTHGGDDGDDGGALGGSYDESGVLSARGRWHHSGHSRGVALGNGSSEGLAPWAGTLGGDAHSLGPEAVWD